MPLSLAALNGVVKVLIAVAIGLAILWIGLTLLRIFAQSPPPPPPPGKMRKVRLNYSCSICGAEVRMTSAPYETPDHPQNCFKMRILQQWLNLPREESKADE